MNNNQGNFNPNFNGQRPNGKVTFEKVKELLLNTPTCKDEIDSTDINENRLINICSYLGIFMLIPFFLRKNSRFTRFHCNQGLILLIITVILNIIKGIINGVIGSIFMYKQEILWGFMKISVVTPFGKFLQGIVDVCFGLPIIILIIVGIYNVVKGRTNELPFIGKFRLIKTIKADTFNSNTYNQNNMGNNYNSNATYNDYNQDMYNNGYNQSNQNNNYNGTYYSNDNNYQNGVFNNDNDGVNLNK